MQNNSSHNGLYISDFHRQNSMAAQREVLRMSLHPYSREQKLRQIEEFRKNSLRNFARTHVQRRMRTRKGNLRCGGVRNITTEVEIF